jgi:hypothetical protein
MIGFNTEDSGRNFPGIELKDTAILAGWIGGLVLVGALLWILTGPVRDRGLLSAVNRSFAAQRESIRLTEPLPRQIEGREALGRRFALADSAGSLLIFPILNGGISLPVGVLLDDQGKVERLIPLGNHGRQVFDRIPQGTLNVYIRRIEAEEELARGGRR